MQSVTAVEQVGEGVGAMSAFLQGRAMGGDEEVVACAAVLFVRPLMLGRGE